MLTNDTPSLRFWSLADMYRGVWIVRFIAVAFWTGVVLDGVDHSSGTTVVSEFIEVLTPR